MEDFNEEISLNHLIDTFEKNVLEGVRLLSVDTTGKFITCKVIIALGPNQSLVIE